MGYVGKIKDSSGTTHLVASTLFGTCSTAAETAKKVVILSTTVDTIEEGVTIYVKFTYSNTHATPTLQVGNVTAANIYAYGTTKPGTTVQATWSAGSIVGFTYDGSAWIINNYKVSDINHNTDEKVKQTNDINSNDYRVLLSNSANDNEETSGIKKSANLIFNPSTKTLTTSNGYFTKINGVTVGDSPKFTDNDTTYTFADGTNGFTVTPSGGTAQTVTVTPSIANNITGSGTSGYLAKFNGANTLTNGPQLGSSTTTYLRNDGTWTIPSDEKVKSNMATLSSEISTYYLTFSDSINTQTDSLLKDNGIRYMASEKTSSAYGQSILQLGSENFSYGALRLYTEYGGYSILTQADTIGAIGHILPTVGGELVNLTATQSLSNKTLSNCYISTLEKASGDIAVKSTLTFASGAAIKMADKIAMQIYKENNVNCFAIGIDTLRVTLYGSSYYLSSGAAITSDKRLKTNIETVDNRYLNLIKNLEPKRFKLKNNPEQKYHTGFIAQDVQELLKKYNINEEEFAAFARPKEDDSEYALSYNEFIPLLLLYIKDLEKQIKELKEQQ